MKTPRTSVHNILLAAAMALPLIASAGAARADDMGADGGRPPMMHAAPDQDGQRGPGREGPEHGDRGPGPGFHGMPPFGGPGMGGHPPLLHGLELSEAQQDQVFAILHAEQPYLREQGKAAAKAHEALRALGHSDKYDDAKAAALAKEAATAMANIALQHVRTEQKLLAVLTPEQRKKQADGIARHAPRP
ncbi:Spy/CpxP family protein refolding chaperone [Rugamonas aquatica]|uniref:Periplasmic heavy metal sensor n=1 Tax=Rugamonas aquatica TaxID=2743357 RepID=A0A6A7MX78_9BURK|nr:periplasmic heavy metal sensor [Rugamonas aquatica]MQA37340.1 periplasmic heavy metal sensor [Rugamonas aquatica]